MNMRPPKESEYFCPNTLITAVINMFMSTALGSPLMSPSISADVTKGFSLTIQNGSPMGTSALISKGTVNSADWATGFSSALIYMTFIRKSPLICAVPSDTLTSLRHISAVVSNISAISGLPAGMFRVSLMLNSSVILSLMSPVFIMPVLLCK